MKHITRLFCLLAALFMTACVGDAGFYISSSNNLDEKCLPDSTSLRASGTLDVSLQPKDGAYVLGLILKNDLDSNASETAPAQRNNIAIRHIILETTIDGETIEETLDLSGTIEAGGSTLLTISILGAKTYEKIQSVANDTMQVANIKLKIKGKLLGGEWVTTPPYYFPIYFFTSNSSPLESCAGVITVNNEEGCQRIPQGQDGAVYQCKIEDSDIEANNESQNV